MKKKLLIAPNSFKEVADADKVAVLFNQYLREIPNISIEILPITDGGDGFLNVCKSVFNLEIIKYKITSPYNEATFDCEVGYERKRGKIFIESARVLGLKVIPQAKRRPLELSSKGLGDLLIKIIEDINANNITVNELIIGVGGTGTSDLGLGVCSRFGLDLYDIYGKKDKIIPEYFYRVKEINWERPALPFQITTIVDVENPLLGSKGAARTFGPQKGADKGEVEVLELGFKKIVNIMKDKKIQRSYDKLSGAGGGLAAGLYLFFKASNINASEFILKILKLEEISRNKDVIITGEGNFDEQSLYGKGAGVVLDLATRLNKKIFLCCGKVDDKVRNRIGKSVEIIEFVSFFNDKKESMNNIEKGIELASRKIASLL